MMGVLIFRLTKAEIQGCISHKQWLRGRTKIQNLMRLGVPEDLAVPCGASNKSYWRSEKTAAMHMALNNDFFSNMGLISLRDRWIEIHYP